MAKRMKLISEADFNRLNENLNSILPNCNESSFVKNNHNAHELLQSHTIPDDIKVAMYSGLMNSISENLKKILETPILVKSVDDKKCFSHDQSLNISSLEDDTTTDISDTTGNSAASAVQLNNLDNQFLAKLPEKCRRKAGDIMLTLKQNAELIRWNKNGEVAFFDQDFEAGSSIVDLLSFVVHDLKWSVAPKASNRFLLCLKRLNVPLSLMRADVRKMLSKDLDHITDIKSASNSPSYFVQMKSKLKNWVSLKEESQNEFRPSTTSTPKKS